MLLFQSPSSYDSQNPGKRLRSKFPNGVPMERVARVQSLLLHVSRIPQ